MIPYSAGAAAGCLRAPSSGMQHDVEQPTPGTSSDLEVLHEVSGLTIQSIIYCLGNQ